MFLSVIIPTYRNTKEEIERCLGSIYQSDWRDFEVLLADDGNTADYAAYLDTLPVRFPGLRILHLPHGGESSARNGGIKAAKGEFILFADADDVVSKQFCLDIQEIAEDEPSVDVIYGRVQNAKVAHFADDLCEELKFYELNEDERRELYGHFFALQVKKYVKADGAYLSRGPIARLVRRTLALRCPFRLGLIMGPDMVWNLDMLKGNPRVAVTDHVWYYIVGNPESVTRGYRPEFVEWHRQLLQVLREYITPDTKKDYRQRIYESLAEIGRKYYLSPQNSLSWFQKVKEFNQVAWSEPFDAVLETNEKMGGGKGLLKLVFYKTGLLLYAYKLKMLLGR